ncbi:MAG: VWA domain-containing protein [Alphaproteobacteria bacterium]|nr:VWA domain-containing protein [Alphaproteobacteria bacterium]
MSPEGTDVPAAPGGPEADKRIVRKVLAFARQARDNGFPVGIEEALDALTLAGGLDLLDRDELRRGLRTLFCSSTTDWERFDDLFDSFWFYGSERTVLRISGSLARPGGAGETPGMAPRGFGGETDAADETAGGASRAERLEGTDFRHLHGDRDLQAVQDLSERLARRMRWRLSRRHRLRRRGRVVDLRNTIHKSLRHGGMPLDLAYRRRHPRPLKLVMLLDASGSMNLYSTFFIRFIRAVVENFAQAEAFIFHTRLVHISAVLRERDLEKAIDRMNILSAGWGGGTRLGASLKTFNDNYAKQVLNARSVVMILSDGYDTGPPEALGRELGRLRKRAHRTVWLNPLLGWQGYEPVAQGMAAALPHLDLFAPAHNLESLAALEPYLCRL